jgi:hypothetical protein
MNLEDALFNLMAGAKVEASEFEELASELRDAGMDEKAREMERHAAEHRKSVEVVKDEMWI